MHIIFTPVLLWLLWVWGSQNKHIYWIVAYTLCCRWFNVNDKHNIEKDDVNITNDFHMQREGVWDGEKEK